MHERFTPGDIAELREANPGVVVLAHPECPPDVVAVSDFAGSTAAMADYVTANKPARVVLMTECSMSDNVAVLHPDVDFIRPLQSLPAYEADHAAEHPAGARGDAPRGDARSGNGGRRATGRRAHAGGMTPEIQRLNGSPVIIGAGLAGLMTALHLAPEPVLLLSAAPLGTQSSSGWAQGGLAASLGTDDSPKLHLADTLAAGDGLCDPDIAKRVTRAAPAAIEALIRYGAVFDRVPDGALRLGLEAAHQRRRIVHAAGDGTGRELMRALVEAARRTPSITILEGVTAQSLLLADGKVAGVLARDGAGRLVVFETNRVVIATGGVGGLFPHSSNPLISCGQGLALAARAGALLADMEFVQFHPTVLDGPARPMPLISEAVRGEGATLIDESGERFMAGAPGAELAPRDVVARRVWAHLQAGHRVFLDARSALGPSFPRRFPTIAARLPGRGHRSGDASDPGAAGGALSHGRHRRGR